MEEKARGLERDRFKRDHALAFLTSAIVVVPRKMREPKTIAL
jgi:hypothetical protein